MAGTKNSGRRKKPTSLKLLSGSYDVNPERRNASEPIVEDKTRPVAPEHLGELAKAEWDRVCDDLEKVKVLTAVDFGALEKYCAAYERWRECYEQVNAEGVIIRHVDAKGVETLKRNPAQVEANALHVLMMKFYTEYGLTPSSRASLTTGEKIDSKEEAKRRFLA